MSDVTYTSFGRADGVSYSVNVTNRSVVVMFSNGDSVGEASRSVCQYMGLYTHKYVIHANACTHVLNLNGPS